MTFEQIKKNQTENDEKKTSFFFLFLFLSFYNGKEKEKKPKTIFFLNLCAFIYMDFNLITRAVHLKWFVFLYLFFSLYTNKKELAK